VLCGRGNNINFHSGNKYFRSLVKSLRLDYVNTAKGDKAYFGKHVVKHIRSLNPPGRFLSQDAKTGRFNDIGDKKALDKTRQALREGAPEIEKKIEIGEIVVPAVSTNILAHYLKFVFICVGLPFAHISTISQQYACVQTLITQHAKEVYKETFPDDSAPTQFTSNQPTYQSRGQLSVTFLEQSQFNPVQMSDNAPPIPTTDKSSYSMGRHLDQDVPVRAVSHQSNELYRSSDYSSCIRSDQFVAVRGINRSPNVIYNPPQPLYEEFLPEEMPPLQPTAVLEATAIEYEDFLPVTTSLNHSNQYEDFLPEEIQPLAMSTSQTFREDFLPKEKKNMPQSFVTVSPKGYEDFLPKETQPAPSPAVSPKGYEDFLPGADSRKYSTLNKHSRDLQSESQTTAPLSNRSASVQHYNSLMTAPCSNRKASVRHRESKSNGNYKSGTPHKHIYDIDTGERISISALLESSGSSSTGAEWKRYNSLYLADLESRGRADRRGSVKMLQYIKAFQALQDDDDDNDEVFEGKVDNIVKTFQAHQDGDDDNDEVFEGKVDNTVSSLDRNSMSSFSMASLSDSLGMSIDYNADSRCSKRRYSKMSTVTRRSILMSLVLRQSALAFDESDEDNDGDAQQNEANSCIRRKTGSINTAARYVPDVFGSKVDRRRDSIVESSTQLLASVYGQEVAEVSMIEPERRKTLLNSFLALSVDDFMLDIAEEHEVGIISRGDI